MEDPCVLVATEPATFLGAARSFAINIMFTFVVVVLHFPGLCVLFMTVSHKTLAKSIRPFEISSGIVELIQIENNHGLSRRCILSFLMGLDLGMY